MKKLTFFEQRLAEYFRLHGRKLPWRRRRISAYEVWISEILLQQTQVSRVVEYYIKMLKRFPTVADMARTDWETFLPYYQGLGYYRRGRNMLACAKIIHTQYADNFPHDKKTLMSLPGIGEYTANAILAFAYNHDVLAWDTNLQKVFGRYLEGTKNAPLRDAELGRKLQHNKRTLNAAIMDFANDICVRIPRCHICPIRSRCAYFQTNGVHEPTSSRIKKTFPTRDAQVFLFLHKDHKMYYSSHKEKYDVFILPPEKNTRDAVKKYFKDTYQLDLAVRPPHQKVYVDGQPTFFVHAQILLGKPGFTVFSPESKKHYVEKLQSFIHEEE